MYFIDVQGTLISDDTRLPICGAVEFINRLNESKTPYMVITNSTKYSSEEFLRYLQSIGLNISKDHYLDPLMVLEHSLEPMDKVAAYGSKEFLNVIASMGYELDFSAPSVVLVAIKEDFSHEEYAQMIQFLLSGAKLIGMHETALYAKNGKRYPGVGAILKLLEFAASSPYRVVGKPSNDFFAEALKRLQLQDPAACYENVTIISDDVRGDLIGAQRLGMKGVFVLSGKYRKAEEIIPFLADDEVPHRIYADIGEMGERI